MKRYGKMHSERIPKSVAWFLLVVGVVLGTVFTFGMRYWEASVTRDEAIYVEAEYASYEILYGRHRSTVSEVKLFFNDREPLFIDGACCNQGVFDKLEAAESGAVFKMYLHPNSNTLLEIQNNDVIILQFENAVDALMSEISAFLILGILMYLIAVFALIKLIRKETY